MLIGTGWRLEKKIAEGEFSVGFRATHELLGMPGFVKQARKKTPAYKEAFRREAKILGTISVPGVPAFREYAEATIGNHDGVPCIVMELVEGGTPCNKLLAGDTPYDVKKTLWILYRTASILNKIHTRYATAHADVRPDNVLIDTEDGYGSVNLVDFGLAMALNGSKALLWDTTDPPPELEAGLPATKAIDYYGLGSVGRYLLTGGSTHRRVWAACRPDLPRAVWDLVDELSHQDPDQRLQDYDAVRQRIERLQNIL